MFNLGEISMKKSLVALAVLAATGAYAQSSVTLYGRLDLGFNNIKTSNTTGLPAALTLTSKTTELAGAQGTRTGGRLGVRGTEDLGGGLRAGFNIETRVNPDASASTFGTTRAGNLSLTGGFGTIVIGTYQNAFDDVRYAHNPDMGGIAGGDFLGRNITGGAFRSAVEAITSANPGSVAASAGNTLGFSDRSENSIGYRSPSFGGFVLRANLLSQKAVLSGIGSKTNGMGFAAGYDNGPLGVIAAFGTGKTTVIDLATPPNGNSGKINDFGFSVKYDLGVAVPFVQYETSKATSNVANVSSFVKVNAFAAGANFPLGAFTPYFTVGTGKHKTNTGALAKGSAFQIGTKYDVSKRTYVYAGFGTDKTKGDGVGNTFSTKRSSFATGLVHSF
jgi:predicted porin